jgi:hypothetical protein
MSSAPGSSIELGEREHLALFFHVLAHVNLGSDAASLFDGALDPQPWAATIEKAYARAPGRLAIHGRPLLCETRASLFDWLGSPDGGMADEAGRQLGHALIVGMEAESDAFSVEWRAELELRRRRVETMEARLVAALDPLRAALWERQGGAPPLLVLNCPAMGRHGRAIRHRHGHVVAVSLDEPFEMSLCQIFHEEVHPISDPAVLNGRDGGARDTRAGRSGHGLHAELEIAAIEVGQAVIDARLPELSPAYARWRARYRVPR